MLANLELARAEAELPPGDRGDFTSTLGRLFGALTVPEAERLLLLALLVWAGALAGEALRGRAWRLPVVLASALVALAVVPLLVAHAREGAGRVMIVSRQPLSLLSEPRADATTLLRLGPGDEVRPTDALPGWLKVEADGVRGWIRDAEVEASDPPVPAS